MTQQAASQTFRQRVKQSDLWWARAIRQIFFGLRYAQVPTIQLIHKPLWHLHHGVRNLVQTAGQKLYFSPLFKSRLRSAPRRLFLYCGMPQLGGRLEIHVGENCRLSGVASYFGRSCSAEMPTLTLGNNVDVGWQCTIAVGQRVTLKDNVRLAGKCYLAGFPGHPEDPAARALGLPETEDQVGDIVLNENVWLATGVTVLAGVTIGENSIVGAGSVVTHDIPPNVVAAGVPARAIRPIAKAEAK